MEHHKYQVKISTMNYCLIHQKGVEGVDVDVPTKYEGDIFRSAPAKTLWMFCQPLMYVFRPLLVKPKDPGFWEFVNWTSCIATDLFILYFWGNKALGYLILSTFLSNSFQTQIANYCRQWSSSYGWSLYCRALCVQEGNHARYVD